MSTDSIATEPLLVTLTGTLPVEGQVTDLIRSVPSSVVLDRGRYEMVLTLDDATVPADVQFHPLAPLVWLQFPRPEQFGDPTVDSTGRICTFPCHNEDVDDVGRYEFLIRLTAHGQQYLSQDPTIYNKPDPPVLTVMADRLAAVH